MVSVSVHWCGVVLPGVWRGSRDSRFRLPPPKAWPYGDASWRALRRCETVLAVFDLFLGVMFVGLAVISNGSLNSLLQRVFLAGVAVAGCLASAEILFARPRAIVAPRYRDSHGLLYDLVSRRSSGENE